jgi:hypothetical protein
MCETKPSWLVPTAMIMLIGIFLAVPALGQDVLYNNGPDGDVGYYHVNFGSVVANSFVLSSPATVTNVILTIYDVDDRNVPENLKWTITTEPFGGTTKASGFASLAELGQPYITQFLFFAWKMGFTIPNLALPAGTYYLQIQDVVTRWDTWAFWAETSGGSSQGYYEAIGPNGAGTISPVPSETFEVAGEWMPRAAE